MRYDYLIFIGRFQPFHLGHESVVTNALTQTDKIIILVGSPYQPRTVRNPWDFNERERFIRANFSEEDNRCILVLPLMDNIYNDAAWIRSVQQIVSGVVHATIGAEPHIGLIGHQKDESSYYLNQFPQWERVEVANHEDFSSTDIRNAYFDEEGEIVESLSVPVAMALDAFRQTKGYVQVAEEQRFVKAYKKGWEAAPYEPVFVTVDALVIQSGHILLVERKAQPGRGLKALPGGFVNPKEKLVDAVIRELREETRIKVPAPVLKGSISKTEVFDDPYRSARGRTITHAYLIELHDGKLPKVKGGDDAAKAFWVPFAEVKPEMMFEDHYHIIQAMIG
jgi:bifunctional NMN adenylyltransferase/nudix hydrolase